MREIKFRALDEFSDQWIYGQAFFIDSDNEQGYIANGISDLYCVKKETVGQYTGLKDKNGKEIYEGDVCIGLMDGGLDYTSIKFAVEYNIASFEDSYFHRPLMSEKQNLEVIGNLYENPKLKEEIGKIYENPELLEDV